ncbi:MAG: hypothetical protein M3O61_15005, partial [Gemmatimonadota bacterium]|nr:hypothetical protein [Gemmatimonadota bacterium]
GRLTKAKIDGAWRAYVYTASDERIGTIALTEENGTEQGSSWTIRDIEGKVLRRYAKSGSTWTWNEDYIYRGSQMLAAEVPGGTKHFHLDHLGTPRLVTDSEGVEISRHTYYPFGYEVGAATSGEKQFTGHERDSPTLDYMHARYYGPTWGRFLSVDPYLDLHKATRNPQNWNRYAYVRNNPINLVDPDGRDDVNVGPDFEVAGAAGSPEKHKEFLNNFGNVLLGSASVVLATVVFDAGPEFGDGELPKANRQRSSVQANKKAGDAFRDPVADGLKAEGRDVQKEVVKKTPFGPRVIDIEVSQGGKVRGGIETKVGNSPYKPSQRAKDWWLRKVKDYIVVVVRQAL